MGRGVHCWKGMVEQAEKPCATNTKNGWKACEKDLRKELGDVQTKVKTYATNYCWLKKIAIENQTKQLFNIG
jgi:hypothetical protein